MEHDLHPSYREFCTGRSLKKTLKVTWREVSSNLSPVVVEFYDKIGTCRGGNCFGHRLKNGTVVEVLEQCLNIGGG